MAKFNSLKPLAAGMGAALVATAMASTTVNAAENPFATTSLSAGYQLADAAEGKCGEGKCGEGREMKSKKDKEGKCGEAKKAREGNCGEGMGKAKEGNCGEGMGMKSEKAKEGNCGAGKK